MFRQPWRPWSIALLQSIFLLLFLTILQKDRYAGDSAGTIALLVAAHIILGTLAFWVLNWALNKVKFFRDNS